MQAESPFNSDTMGSLTENRPKSGWNSPDYTVSRRVILDPAHLEKTRCTGFFPDMAANDPYKVLRTQVLMRMQEKNASTVMITSARPGEGKTLTALNMAFVCARDYTRTVLLVDCDLKQQHVHKYLGIPSGQGLSDYLINDTPLKDLIIWPDVDKFTFISGGAPVSDSTELLSSPRMQSLIPEMKARYAERIIIFDTPPILESADALAFIPFVECVLVIADCGHTSREDLSRALSLVPQEKLLGLVFNRYERVHDTIPPKKAEFRNTIDQQAV